MNTSTNSSRNLTPSFLAALVTIIGFFNPNAALAQIQVWIPAVTTTIWHEPWTERVWQGPVMGTCQVPEVGHFEPRLVPGVIHHPATPGTIHHPATSGVVHHPATTGVVHHPATTVTVHHPEEVGVRHVDRQTHIEHHPAETHTVVEEGYYDTYWVDYYATVCDVYCAYETEPGTENYYEVCWEENCREDEWIGGGWVDEWVEGYEYTVTTDAWDEEVTDVEEHDENYLIDAWDENVPVPAWDEPVEIPEWDEPFTSPPWDEPIIVPAWDEPTVTTVQDWVVDVPAHPEPCQITEGRFVDVEHPGWPETITLADGYWRPLTPGLAKMVVNGDYPTFDWNTAGAAALATPIYSGDFNGDMASWSVGGLSEADPLTYTWKATGPETINGPSGQGKSEWKIATGGAAERLSWKPGDYVIRCDISRSNGQSAHVEYTQPVGWRTDRFLVVGQVRPIDDFVFSASQQAAFKADLIADAKNTGPLKYASWSSTLSQQIDALAGPAPLSMIMSFWSALNSLPGQRDASFPSVPFNARYYMMQELLNQNPDTQPLGDTLSNVDKVNLLELQAYRMLAEYQTKYLVGTDGKMIRDTVTSVGSPATPGGLAQLALGGPTKFTLPSWAISVLNTIGVPNNGTQLEIPSLPNLRNGVQRIDRAGGRISLYNSGRINLEASYINWALFHRDVPWIFSEVIFGLDSAGRDRQNTVPMSVNRRWNKAGLASGSVHFNEIVIYRRNNGSDQYLLDRRFTLGNGANMLQPFIDSIPYGQWSTVPGTGIPNPYADEPVPEVLNTP